MCINDDREAERDEALAEARGKFHRVTIRVTVQQTVDIPGQDHETADLKDYLDEVVEGGEIVDWEEV